MEVRPLIAFIVRILQIVFCVICLATSGHWAKTWAPFKFSAFQVFTMLQSVNLAIFASVTGFLLSAFLLFAPRVAPKVADDLPGLVDLLLSAVWAVFFLSAGSSLVSWGTCKQNSLCAAWNATVGLCFFLWILYTVTAVLAALDLRAQIQALRAQAGGAAPSGTVTPNATPVKKADPTPMSTPRPATPDANV